MQGDRIGLQIQTDATNVNGILLCLEVTDEIIAECKQKKFNTIISFHPLIYAKLSHITLEERVGRLCSYLIKDSINLITVHSTFDAYQDGTSKILADILDLNVTAFLVPSEIHPNCGMGVIATPKQSITTIQLAEKIYHACGSPVRYCGCDNAILNKIAIVGGSGTFFLPQVEENQCDCFITADATYHQFHAARGHFVLIDVGHYEMEQFVPKAIQSVLKDFLDDNNIEHATTNSLTNPIQYYPDNNYINTQKQNLI
jgi:dinuclear metal center YbgI/SA1388 family protein